MSLILVAACGILVAATIAAEERQHKLLEAGFKTGASLCFVGFGWVLGAPASALLALSLGLVGDVLLVGRSKPAFLAGLIAFLSSHVAWIATFVALDPSVPGVVATVLALVPLALVVWRWLDAPVAAQRMTGPVIGYLLVITAMVATAAGVVVSHPTRAPVLIGAVAFFASDLAVARRRFVVDDPWNRRLGLPLYYAAQLVLASAVT